MLSFRPMAKRKCTGGAALEPHGRTLLLAGGTDGIGFAFLEAECQRNTYSLIYVLGRDFRQVNGLSHDGRIVNVVCDVTDATRTRLALVDAAVRRVDDFVDTIGTFARGPVSEMTDEEVSSHFELNCVGNINLIRAVLPLMLPERDGGDDAAGPANCSGARTGAQMLVYTASLALEARSPYALQSATKAGLKFFVDALRIELKGKVRVMSVLPPSVDTCIFAKAGDTRDTSKFPPASRVADAMRWMLDCPPDVCVPELLLEQHRYER